MTAKHEPCPDCSRTVQGPHTCVCRDTARAVPTCAQEEPVEAPRRSEELLGASERHKKAQAYVNKVFNRFNTGYY